MFRLTASLVLLLAFAPAQELWVDAGTGSDTNPGSASLPLRSITAALAVAVPGTTIFVRAGTYSVTATGEVFPLQFGNGRAHDGVTLLGLGSVVVDFANGRGNGMRVGTMANGARISNLTFANMDKTDWWTAAISAGTYNGSGAATFFELDRCRFVDVNRGIILWQGVPITGWAIHDNLFVDLGNDGIDEFDPGSANEITNNTFVNTPQLGVLADGNATRIVNNVLVGCRVGIASSGNAGAAAARITSNDFFGNTLDVQGAAFPGGVPPGNLTVDPRFVNPPTRDFRLQATSALIDAGDPRVFLRADLDDAPRAIDGNQDGTLPPDIGAYEFGFVNVTTNVVGGVVLTIDVTSTAPNLTTALLLVAFDEGLINLPGLSPILLDPQTLIPFAFTGAMPWQIGLGIPAMPAGSRLVVQGFGFDPVNLRLIGGKRARAQF
ncbi:MAG: DUF1565 domain-containing protein [Planctomycetes bacterium]|nr:DUF1565 domain-containing protein [Planctomycetota bacterium]